MEYELLIREAEVEDAAELVSFLNRVSVETDFLLSQKTFSLHLHTSESAEKLTNQSQIRKRNSVERLPQTLHQLPLP